MKTMIAAAVMVGALAASANAQWAGTGAGHKVVGVAAPAGATAVRLTADELRAFGSLLGGRRSRSLEGRTAGGEIARRSDGSMLATVVLRGRDEVSGRPFSIHRRLEIAADGAALVSETDVSYPPACEADPACPPVAKRESLAPRYARGVAYMVLGILQELAGVKTLPAAKAGL